MQVKELELITWENIKLDHQYFKDIKKVKIGYSQQVKYTAVPAFSEERGGSYYADSTYIKPNTDSNTKLMRTVKTLGVSIEVNVIEHLPNPPRTFQEFNKEYPTLAKELKKRIPKDWFEKANAETVKIRQIYINKVQKQYDELTTVFTELEHFKDLANMQELDDLLYCEAEAFMMKMEGRIHKRANAKNLKLSKALNDLRDKPNLNCSEG